MNTLTLVIDMPPPAGTTLFSVSQLTNAIKLRLEEHFPGVWVAGEVANYTRHSSGHMYFTLRDDKSTLKCMMGRAFNLRLKFDPKNGMHVIVRGPISMYPQQGNVQMYVEALEPQGVGAAELALRQLKEKLSKRGYFHPERKRKLPDFPRRVGLIASATGAAIRDMLEMLHKRWPAAHVVVRPSLVQGPNAPIALVEALDHMNQLHSSHQLRFCAIVMGRGGGASEDLAAFNEECVADAIYRSEVPIIAAIGHEVDVSIADMVADLRALTPSDAIVQLCPDKRELMQNMIDMAGRLKDAIQYRVKLSKERVDRLADRPVLRRPQERLTELRRRLDEGQQRLQRAMALRLRRSQDKLSAMADQLDSLSPLSVLKRGFSLTEDSTTGELLRDADQVAVGQTIRTRLERGVILSRVEEIQPAVDDPTIHEKE